MTEIVVYGSHSVTSENDIVVSAYWNGSVIHPDCEAWANFMAWFEENYPPTESTQVIEGVAPPSPPDSASHEVKLNLTHTPTAAEQKAIDNLKARVAAVDAAINGLSDTVVYTLSGGKTATGAEIKDAWSKTDFTINENSHVYANGGRNGEANWNNGNPEIAFNIGTLQGYDAFGTAGLNYLILHELSHLTEVQRANLADAYSDGAYTEAERHAHELEANNLTRALGETLGLNVVNTPGDGYSTDPLPVNDYGDWYSHFPDTGILP